MVGLPARGKTYISRKIARYLTWLGFTNKVFNVGNYRRTTVGATQPHSFFDPRNEEFSRMRLEVAMAALDDMMFWLESTPTGIAIYDATNSSKDRRKVIFERCLKLGVQVMFIESLCDDPDIILTNIKEVKVSSPDYAGMDPEQAADDFMKRINHYQDAYETIGFDESESKMPYVKLINVGNQFIVNMIKGYMQSRIVYYLMNLHITPRSIYFTRHGESE